jgi:hypothetical protein
VIRILDANGNIERTIAFDETDRKTDEYEKPPPEERSTFFSAQDAVGSWTKANFVT